LRGFEMDTFEIIIIPIVLIICFFLGLSML